MKKLAAVALVFILLLNMVGYYLILVGLQYKHTATIRRALDDGAYNPAAGITFRLPIALPYANNQSEFDRVDGVFEFKGEHYRLVKQKYANDTLTIVCIFDNERKQIDQQFTSYVTSFANHGSDDANAKKTINLIKDYLHLPIYDIGSLCFGWQKELTFDHCFHNNVLVSFARSVIQPPENS